MSPSFTSLTTLDEASTTSSCSCSSMEQAVRQLTADFQEEMTDYSVIAYLGSIAEYLAEEEDSPETQRECLLQVLQELQESSNANAQLVERLTQLVDETATSLSVRLSC
eukprot:CAMPEP_0172456176 /NCGR_PEP_ID=MMETSP1065-20121228/14246_1 /TAXON_ID=265537 /ORGANISM="Amphiprora paludosa, Strain CCMP125" /LENGTH=108 /DNA_ID=CAMNT_0013208883 /DNA_START=58 /DNA_END=384 /DNA_ORIENTATION=-